ncbi:hypothetical protein [Jannaschia rubra]|uniref:hypothetical protein n=1 Tax=Jannaschia rubra TaxID=282197 RepID=UPI0006E28C53|nr:hypothetical protein [Jannaschia rubra]
MTPAATVHASDDLECLDEALTAIVGAILQQSNRAAGTIIGVAASKLVAAGVMAGTFAAISAFGVAGTGTAIATLSGAAAASATLYWIGSSIGLGVAAGSLMLTGGAIAIGIPAAMAARKHILGRRRTEEDLDPHEQAALYAALRLAAPIRVARFSETPITPVEMRLFVREGLAPLATTLNRIYTAKPEQLGETTCQAQSRSLAFWQQRRLRGALRQIENISASWMNA